MNIKKSHAISHCKIKKQIMKQPSMGSRFKHPWAFEKIGLLNNVHPKDFGERVRPEQEKKPKKKRNQEQHLDKNDFFTWKLSLSQLASL